MFNTTKLPDSLKPVEMDSMPYDESNYPQSNAEDLPYTPEAPALNSPPLQNDESIPPSSEENFQPQYSDEEYQNDENQDGNMYIEDMGESTEENSVPYDE